MAEAIENNLRKVIIDELAINPKYYEKMSELLDAVIQARKQQALDYQAYLDGSATRTLNIPRGNSFSPRSQPTVAP